MCNEMPDREVLAGGTGRSEYRYLDFRDDLEDALEWGHVLMYL
jgi:hypothetical protein